MTDMDHSGQSLRQLIVQNPSASFDLMTPCGYVYLTPEQSAALLAGSDISAHPGSSGYGQQVSAEELLDQTVHTANCTDGIWHIITMWPEQTQGLRMGGMAMR